jgi:NAD-dependent DNA ligase
MPVRDEHGQPPKNLHFDRTIRRQIAEMLGLAKGIICDGVVTDGEVTALKQWLAANPDVTVAYPGDLVAKRVLSVFEDGVVDEDERAELKDFLLELTGESADELTTMREPTALPLDQPPPTIVFDNREFVFTDLLASGARAWAEQQVVDRGGACKSYVTGKTDFLVIGLMASEAWIQSTHGRKIETAVRWRDKGQPIHIVAEPTWLEAIGYAGQ